jgi:membrane peptidoglycan carboxypeptidase
MRYDPPAKTPPPGPAPTNNEKTGGKSLRKLVWRVLVPTAVVLLGALAGVGFAGMIRMPRVDSLADFTPSLITELFDRDGRVFATYAREKRVLLDEGEIPELLQQAILAAEDANFFQHGGVDAQGVARAAFKNLGAGRKAMGGSTITMQLARQLYLNPKKTWRRKIEEALLAVELEKTYAKQQILTLYANLIFFGHGNYGFEAAARSFFDKSVDELTLPEAAMLAGIPQRPSTYSPYRRPDLVLARRDYVLRRMWEVGCGKRDLSPKRSIEPPPPNRCRSSHGVRRICWPPTFRKRFAAISRLSTGPKVCCNAVYRWQRLSIRKFSGPRKRLSAPACSDWIIARDGGDLSTVSRMSIWRPTSSLPGVSTR